MSKVARGNRISKYYYDSKGYLSRVIDPLGRSVTYVNDSIGRVMSSTTYDGRKTEFSYDDNSRLTKIKTPHKQEHTFTYNSLELLDKYTSPLVAGQSNETSYEYSLDKELIKIILPDAREIDFNYMVNNTRLSSIDTAEGSYTYYYAISNNPQPTTIVETVSPTDTKLEYVYLGSLIASEEYKPVSGSAYSKVSYQYDSKFRLNKLDLEDGAGDFSTPVIYNYNKDDQIIQAGELTVSRDSTLGFISNLKLKNAEII